MGFLAFVVCFIITTGLAKDIKDYDVPELFELFTDLTQVRPKDVKLSDVTFYLFTRNISNQQIFGNQTTIDTAKPSKLIIHGYMDSHERSWYEHLTKEYLKKGDFNIVQVDWKRVALSFYPSTAENSKIVGKLIARFVVNQKMPPQALHFIGHSLGAHIAGMAAQIVKKKTGSKVARITGLDPAGPAFQVVSKKERLSPDDADVVDVVHTDGGFFGYFEPLGTFDIYFNGGIRVQPDCQLTLNGSIGEIFEKLYCSHTRSYVHFIEMINDVKYSCHKCKSWAEYLAGRCFSTEAVSFGAEDINKTLTGICFVKTK